MHLTLRHVPALTLAELKRIVEAAFYFWPILLKALNSGSLTDPGPRERLDALVYDHIDAIENKIHDVESLRRYLFRLEWPDGPRFLTLKSLSKMSLEIDFNSSARGGREIVNQIDYLLAFVEASLSWPASGRHMLEVTWPRTILGLGQFLTTRGTQSTSRAEFKTVCNIITPFTAFEANRDGDGAGSEGRGCSMTPLELTRSYDFEKQKHIGGLQQPDLPCATV